jgi:chemotaxis methyl-accepting protein methylase
LATGSETNDDYHKLIQLDESERMHLITSLKNSYSLFFRSGSVFSMLEDYLVPLIFRQKAVSSHREVRVWSAGCAAGQEPYSLAMVLDYYRYITKQDLLFRIFATDYSSRILDCAINGRYDRQAMDNVKLKYFDRYFEGFDGAFSVNPDLSRNIQFSYYDLLDRESIAPPDSLFGDFDLILCCNVLFYYNNESQLFILNKLARSLVGGGYLITGEAEAEIVEKSGLFFRIGSYIPVYKKR